MQNNTQMVALWLAGFEQDDRVTDILSKRYFA